MQVEEYKVVRKRAGRGDKVTTYVRGIVPSWLCDKEILDAYKAKHPRPRAFGSLSQATCLFSGSDSGGGPLLFFK